MKNNFTDQRYNELARKWLDGTITSEEEQEYANWYNEIEPDAVLEIPAHIAPNREAHRIKILQQIRLKRVSVISIYKPMLIRFASAAAVLLIGCMLFLYWNSKSNISRQVVVESPKPMLKNDVAAGTYGAILSSSGGETIVLDTAQNGELIKNGGQKVIKTGNDIQFASEVNPHKEVEYYTLTTPRARQQQLTLPDGTVVWLNAQSSIKFPSIFDGLKREVEITGEGYFEVAKNAGQPFVVHVNGSVIEVLGTHFNVMAYANEKALETTLIEGAVKFGNGKKNVLLKPGQQIQSINGGDIKLNREVNIEQVVAWKNGMQSFASADIKTIMRQVERWYDVDVEYRGNISLRQFSGDIPRNAKLSELLKLFNVNKIHFEIDALQKKLIVMP